MGEPVFTSKEETAFLEVDNTKHIRFNFNPDFILGPNQDMIPGVIAHEAYHLVLDHFREIADKATFPDTKRLVKAQEIIVNDIIENIYHMPLPEDFWRGKDVLGQDCSQYTSKQIYDLLEDENDQQESPSGSGGQGEGESQDPHQHGCGGTHGDGDSEQQQNAQDLQDAFDNLLQDAADKEGKSKEELMNDALNDHSGGFSLNGPGGETDGNLSRERLNWKHLLAKINPKIMSSGSPKRRTQNNWMKPNRRMISIYPNAILPTVEPVTSSDDGDGDTIPTFVIALDLSGSIPDHLITTLQGLLEDIPEDLIKAYPCTWSSTLVPFDPKTRKVCVRSGTRLSLVCDYVKKIQAETKTDPYVMVITDGQVGSKSYWQENGKNPGNTWYWMAIDNSSMGDCRNAADSPDLVYNVKDFRVA
ncbi:unnamed protein product [Sphagnum balticum]